jgi:hypothetical protein
MEQKGRQSKILIATTILDLGSELAAFAIRSY